MKDVNYDFDETTVTCDECGVEMTVNSKHYEHVNDEMKEEGWINRKVDGTWCEFCSQECYLEYEGQTQDPEFWL